MKIEVPTRHLLAASVFSARQDIRYYLMGVLVEVTPDAIYCVGTNVHALGATRYQRDGGEPGQYIIPIEAFKSLKKPKAADDLATIDILGGGDFRLSAGGMSVDGQLIDSSYPLWRQVIPKSAPSGEAAQFSIELLNKFFVAAQNLSMKKSNPPYVHIGYNGQSASGVSITGHEAEFVGVVAPLRNDYVASDAFIL